jgi:adenosylhomocysteine nucleosidase
MFLSGVSMVNAALTTTMALENFEISHIVFSGIAGGVSPDLHIGDVAVPMQWGNYGKGVYGRGSEAGDTFDFGWHELTFGNFGMFAPQTVTVFSEEAPMPEGESRFWFPVDDAMYAVAETLTEVELNDCVETDDGEVCLEYAPVVTTGGSGVSAPIFVDNAEYRKWVWDTFGAVALDMETAAVAMVAYTYDVPYLAFRSLSDLAGGGPQENEINTFFQLAANNSAEVLLAFMETWAAQSE